MRSHFTWQERARATLRLFELRAAQAAGAGHPAPTMRQLAAEVRGVSGYSEATTRREILVARYLDDPEVFNAPSVGAAFMVVKQKEARERADDLARLRSRS